ncbi:S1 RNA-binding domain-containing protein [Actinomycetospora aeridis]|uniref:S1 RNA-binding domain-containing protein n=1 Tax=Actinomycetospora aeridis TaxID=3129231 RepID=A0ABU8N6L9_9PSEU
MSAGNLADGARILAFRQHFRDVGAALSHVGLALRPDQAVLSDDPSAMPASVLEPLPASLPQRGADGWGAGDESGSDDEHDDEQAQTSAHDRNDPANSRGAGDEGSRRRRSRPSSRRSRVIASVVPGVVDTAAGAVPIEVAVEAEGSDYRPVPHRGSGDVPLRTASMFSGPTVQSALRSMTRVARAGRLPDVPAVVDAVARGRPMRDVPLLTVAGPPSCVRFLVDANLRAGLLAMDIADLEEEARRAFGVDRLETMSYHGTPQAGCGVGARPTWVPWDQQPFAPSTILVRPGLVAMDEIASMAADVARARSQGSRVVEIVVGGRDSGRRSPDLLMVEDEAIPDPDPVRRELLDAVLADPVVRGSPLLALATLLSTPPFVSAAAVRRVRQAFFGPNSLWLELELGLSDVVDGIFSGGLELTDDFRARAWEALRVALWQHTDRVEALSALLVRDDGTSPLLALEEEMVWAHVTTDDGRPTVDRVLADCVRTIVRERRNGISDWASAALWRLPEALRSTPTAWLTAQLCRALGRHPPVVATPESGWDGLLLREVAPLLPQTLVGFVRDGEALEFGSINRHRRCAILVPLLPVMPLVVQWHDGTRARREEIDPAVGTQLLQTGSATVRVSNLAGSLVELEGFPAEAGVPAEIVNIESSLDVLESAWKAQQLVAARVVRAISPTTAVVTISRAPALTGRLRLRRGEGVVSSLLENDITVRLTSVDRPDQRIECVLVDIGPWNIGFLEVGAWVEATVSNVVEYGVFFLLPTGQGDHAVGGLLHRSQMVDADGALWPLPGDLLTVRINSIDRETRQIGLSTIRPPDILAHPTGSTVTATVHDVRPYGFLIELPSGHVALLHNDEIPRGMQRRTGDRVRVGIKQIDELAGRVSLHAVPPIRSGDLTRETVVAPTASKPPPPGRSRWFDEDSPEAVAAIRDYVADRVRTDAGEAASAVRLAHDLRLRFGPLLLGDWLGFERFGLMIEDIVPGAVVEDDRIAVYRPDR